MNNKHFWLYAFFLIMFQIALIISSVIPQSYGSGLMSGYSICAIAVYLTLLVQEVFRGNK